MMIKSRKIILTSTSKQSSQYLKFIKLCSQKAATEVKPRFAFEISNDVEEGFVNKDFNARNHPGIMSHHCTNIKLPFHIEKAIQQIREDSSYSPSSIREEAKSLINYIWYRQTPLEDSELREALEEVTMKLLNKGKISSDFFQGPEQKSFDDLTGPTREVLTRSLKKHVYNWKTLQFNQYTSFVYLWARAAPDYAALIRIFKEIRMRRVEFQPRSLFDFGSGVGTGAWAVDTVWPNICREIYNVDASTSMNNLAERLLQYSANEDTKPPQPNKIIYYRQFLPSSDSLRYDLVVSSRSLFEVGNLKDRARTVNILWRKVNHGGFLVLVEAGTKYGYSVLLEMRDYLLKFCKIQKEKYSLNSPIHVFAPCPHDEDCPRFYHRSKTPCYFGVSYEYPKFINPVHKRKNDLFSYVVLQKEDRRDSQNWPRIVEPLLKKSGHTIIRTCSSEGFLREFVVTKKKHGTLCYKLCKKCKWGDFVPIRPHVDAGDQVPENDNTTLQVTSFSPAVNVSDDTDPSSSDDEKSL